MNKIVSKHNKLIIIDIFVASVIIVGVGFFMIHNLSSLSKYVPKNLIYIFSTLVSLVIGTLYLHTKYPIDVPLFGSNSKNIRNTIIWGSIGSIILVLVNFPYEISLGRKDIPQEHFVAMQQGIHFVVLFLIIAVVMIPFVEELFYRGFLFRLVRNKFGLASAYVVSTGFFALGHKFSTLSIINSLIFCYIYEKTGLIGTSIIAHALLNFVWYAAVNGKSVI